MAGAWSPDEIAEVKKANPALSDQQAVALLDAAAKKVDAGSPRTPETVIGDVMAGPQKLLNALDAGSGGLGGTLGGLTGLLIAALAARGGNVNPLIGALLRTGGAGVGAAAGAAGSGTSPSVAGATAALTTGLGEVGHAVKGAYNLFTGAKRLQPDDVERVRTALNVALRDNPLGGGLPVPGVQFPPGPPPDVVDAFTQALSKRSPTGLHQVMDQRFKAYLDLVDRATGGQKFDFPTLGQMSVREAMDAVAAKAIEGAKEGVPRGSAAATFALGDRNALVDEITSTLRRRRFGTAADLIDAAREEMARYGSVERLLLDSGDVGTSPLGVNADLNMRNLQDRVRALQQGGGLDPRIAKGLEHAAHRGGSPAVRDQPGEFSLPFGSLGPTGLRFGFNLNQMLQYHPPTFAGTSQTLRALQPGSPLPAELVLMVLGQQAARSALRERP